MFDASRMRSGLEGLVKPGRHGRADGPAGVTMTLCAPRALASVMARKGSTGAAAAAVGDRYGLALPMAPKRVARDGVGFVWAGPGNWLAMSQTAPPAAFEQELRERLGAAASIVDQSGGWLIFSIAGPRVRDMLAKVAPIDLHESVFAGGDAASTLAGHIGVQLWLLDDARTFEIAVMRSYAQSLWRLLAESAAEFGLEVF